MYLVLENQSLKVTIHYKPIREETPEMFITENIKRRDIPSVIQELGLPKSIYTLLINQPYLEIGNETYASNSGLLERHRCESSARVLTLELDTPISEQIRNEMDGFVKIIVASDYEHVSKRLKDLDKPVECHLLYASEHTSTLFTITKPSLIDNLCRYVDFLTFKYEGIMFLEHDYIARTPDFLIPELELFFQDFFVNSNLVETNRCSVS